MHHRLTGLATECLLELRHIRHDVVDAKLRHGVRVGKHAGARCLRSRLVAPEIAVGKEESLEIGDPVLVLVLESLPLVLQIVAERGKR